MFPLPEGICRKVCRPVRRTPRVTKPGDVARMATAAVRHGASECAVLGAVYAALEGAGQAGHVLMVEEGLDELQEAVDELDGALFAILEDILGIKITSTGQIPDDETIFEKFLRRIKQIMRVKAIAEDLIEVVKKWVALRVVMKELQRNIGLLLECLRGRDVIQDGSETG